MPSGIFTLKQQELALGQGAWTNQKPLGVDYLVVAGGGGAAIAGGGAGGLLQGNLPVTTGSAITVTIGGGGSGGPNESTTPASSGSNSVFGSITATGGGKGGTWYSSSQNAVALGASGGSGGGSAGQYTYSSSVAGAQGTAGQGNAGGSTIGTTGLPYYNAGGGGAGTVGLNSAPQSYAGNGGAGIASDISGTRTTYAGGGGGGRANGTTDANVGKGGAGGGGDAATTGGAVGSNGTANTGGGGGAGNANTGGNGGSGIVILSYPDTYAAAASTTGSPTVSTSGSGSIGFNGTTNELNYGSNSAFAFGTGAYTVEFFVYLNAAPSSTFQPVFVCADSTNGWIIYNSSNNLIVGARGVSNNYSVTSLQAGVWNHVVVVRSGTGTNQFSIFVNGTRLTNTTDSIDWTVTGPLKVGGITLANYYLNGYISNVRIVKGTAIYDPTSSTITQPTAPLTAVTNTQLLLSAVSGAYLTDSSANSFAPASATVAGSWNSSSPFATGLGYKNRVYTWTSSGSITF